MKQKKQEPPTLQQEFHFATQLADLVINNPFPSTHQPMVAALTPSMKQFHTDLKHYIDDQEATLDRVLHPDGIDLEQMKATFNRLFVTYKTARAREPKDTEADAVLNIADLMSEIGCDLGLFIEYLAQPDEEALSHFLDSSKADAVDEGYDCRDAGLYLKQWIAEHYNDYAVTEERLGAFRAQILASLQGSPMESLIEVLQQAYDSHSQFFKALARHLFKIKRLHPEEVTFLGFWQPVDRYEVTLHWEVDALASPAAAILAEGIEDIADYVGCFPDILAHGCTPEQFRQILAQISSSREGQAYLRYSPSHSSDYKSINIGRFADIVGLMQAHNIFVQGGAALAKYFAGKESPFARLMTPKAFNRRISDSKKITGDIRNVVESVVKEVLFSKNRC